MIGHIVDCVVALAALVAILDYFGIKPKRPLWGILMPLTRNWKLGIMLTLVLASLGMSGYGFYRSLRPKIVDKTVTVTVEKPVDKLVQAECPKAESKATPKTPKPKKDTDAVTPAAPQQTTINAPNGIGISGGNVEHPTVNNFGTPPANFTYKETANRALGIFT